MVLTVGIGNTRITLGFFEGETLQGRISLSTHREWPADEYTLTLAAALRERGIAPEQLEGAILSSVVPSLTGTLTRAVSAFLPTAPLVVGPGIKTGFSIRIDNPAQLGSDMVASIAGTLERYPHPLVVVEMGTAVTMTVLDSSATVVGASIAPGMRLALRALCSGTAQLPDVSLEQVGSAIGRNTADALRSGVVLGTAAMVDGMLAAIETELGETPTVILTGADAPFILEHCRTPVHHDPDLPLWGLYRLYRKNRR